MPRSQQPKEAERLIIEEIQRLKCGLVLDVGCGDGRWGELLGDIVPLVYGIEVWADYIEKYELKKKYDVVIHDNAAVCMLEDFFFNGIKWDAIIFSDVIEHMEKGTGQAVLRKVRAAGVPCFLIIPTGGDTRQDGRVYGNPYESHISFWSHADVIEEGFVLIHEGTNENGLVTIGTYKGNGMAEGKIKYSFILPYYDRAKQFEETLRSFDLLYRGRDDFEVVIVRDSKCDYAMNRELADIVEQFDFPVITIDCNTGRPCYNPAPAFNLGVASASGEYVILTSPECKHTVDILAGFDEEFAARPFSYVVCACLAENRKVKKKREQPIVWYQHGALNNKQYHFCSCLKKDLFYAVGGFDERFTDGYGYDDDAFRDRVRMKGIFFKNRDDLVVFHQLHDKVKPADWKERLARNRALYEKEYLGQ